MELWQPMIEGKNPDSDFGIPKIRSANIRKIPVMLTASHFAMLRLNGGQ